MIRRLMVGALSILFACAIHASGDDWVHIVESDAVAGEVHVRYSGEVMLSRSDFHARAQRLPLLRPRQTMLIGMPFAGTMTLSPADTLRVLDTVTRDGSVFYAAIPPRGSAVQFAFLVAADGAFDGSLAILSHAGNGRLRVDPSRTALRADLVPVDGRFLPQYRVDEVDRSRSFTRYAWVFQGVDDGRVRLEKRVYSDAAPDESHQALAFSVPALPGSAVADDLVISLIEVEPKRLKYRVDAL